MALQPPAPAQGLMAGTNAALKATARAPFVGEGQDGFDLGVLRHQRFAHDLDAARDLVLFDVLELAQDEVMGRGPGAENDQGGS